MDKLIRHADGRREVQAETAQDKARREDFALLVLCQLKGNMAMYELLRDRSLDEERKQA